MSYRIIGYLMILGFMEPSLSWSMVLVRQEQEHTIERESSSWFLKVCPEIAGSALIGANGMSHPLLRNNNMELLYSLAVKAKKIIQKKAGDRHMKIVSLGQSAAWLVYMMQALDAFSCVDNSSYGHIAFSKHFFNYDQDTQQLVRIVTPSHAQKKKYRRYLRKSGLVDNKKFLAIIEFCCYTRGIMSFHEVAHSKLPSDMTYLITPPACPHRPPKTTLLPSASEEMDNLLFDLRNSDKFNDRRVQQFPLDKWEHVDPLDFRLSKEATLLENCILYFLQNRDYYSDDSSSDSVD